MEQKDLSELNLFGLPKTDTYWRDTNRAQKDL